MKWRAPVCLFILAGWNPKGKEDEVVCKVCMQTFMCTTSEVKCKEHAEAKHPKADLYACFPHLQK
ncbi:unnamed protein product [Thlaspi arvense]|uniref:At2g23090-like zinc-binding domain-containing protein n=1 Tax=Thlaspi arvense TaxID=13288 RepID=A0AAU9RYG0_THLAR|nr:unnamed protein product [Thlaspi arvense]